MALQGAKNLSEAPYKGCVIKKMSEVPYKGCVTVDGLVQDLEFGAEKDCKFWGLMTVARNGKFTASWLTQRFLLQWNGFRAAAGISNPFAQSPSQSFQSTQRFM